MSIVTSHTSTSTTQCVPDAGRWFAWPSGGGFRGRAHRLRLYRDLTAAGIRCEVVAPSKLHKPAVDRVKTEAKDAIHLAKLLRLDELTSVPIPSIDQGAARDLVRHAKTAVVI